MLIIYNCVQLTYNSCGIIQKYNGIIIQRYALLLNKIILYYIIYV